jgi:hypothetical protein
MAEIEDKPIAFKSRGLSMGEIPDHGSKHSLGEAPKLSVFTSPDSGSTYDYGKAFDQIFDVKSLKYIEIFNKYFDGSGKLKSEYDGLVSPAFEKFGKVFDMLQKKQRDAKGAPGGGADLLMRALYGQMGCHNIVELSIKLATLQQKSTDKKDTIAFISKLGDGFDDLKM